MARIEGSYYFVCLVAVIAAVVAFALTGCQSLTDAIVSAKCGPDGANDYYAGRLGLPTHIACDGPSRGFLSRKPAYR